MTNYIKMDNSYIKIDNSYINTAFITSVLEVTHRFRSNNEWKSSTLVEIHTVDGGTFYFNGTLDDAMTLIKGV